MLYSNDVIEEVQSANEIVNVISSYVNLQQKGNSYFGLCPFHNEKSPSFCVNPERQMYHCFGCGESGNVFTFIMKMENFNFGQAIRFLAERVNHVLPEFKNPVDNKKMQYKNKLLKIHVDTAKFFYHNLLNSQIALDYVKSRNINEDIKKKFGLGYSKSNGNELYKYLAQLDYSKKEMIDSGLINEKNGKLFDRFFNRLMFPIFNIYGKVIGFGARTLNNSKPKYLNSPETLIFNKSSNLYNINLACKSKSKKLILTEGYMDVISLYQAGFQNVAAVLGTALSIKHARLIKNHFDCVILLFDSDQAGVKAVLRSIPILNSVGLETKVLQVTDAKDPDEYIKKFGSAAFSNLLDSAVDSIEFEIMLEKKNYNLENAADKIKFTKSVSQIISGLQDTIQKEVYINEISKTMQISPEAIKFEMDKQNLKMHDIKKNDNPIIKNKSVIDKAQSDIINIAIKNLNFCQQIKKYLMPNELSGLYEKILEFIYAKCQMQLQINFSQIINNFENPDDQSFVAQMLNENIMYDDYEKAVSDIIKTIKKYNVEQKILNTKDVKELKSLLEEKKAIDAIHINLY